ncbi:nitrate- and nitrite sensing domain-containing protein [Streptomyces hilarionis]|uniref:nitrate- and nitrite sensing domain-containing protein n=1 Tax=Streptomyces hilarionis TaxID=2839954 RepID=UPI00211A3E20|nr:nitrate- and nitrite sensing domain-containing protein [Streptomyces hilarionis]MCQ9129845.1 nitrate- and nitrite sensing domain-containing protein [Streptomyces hilarionis]
MRFRGKSIRRKIVALLLVPLVSLTAIWGFATVLTGREASRLFTVSSLVEKVGYPIEDTVRVVQQERRQALVFLADPRAADALSALRRTRTATDDALAEIRGNARDPDVREVLDQDDSEGLTAVLDAFAGIDDLRRSVEERTVTRAQALGLYTQLIDPCYSLLVKLDVVDSVEMDKQYRALVSVAHARELLSQEDALLGSALVVGRLTRQEIREVSDLQAQREVVYDISLVQLPTGERERYESFWKNATTAPLRTVEQAVVRATPGDPPRGVSAKNWDTAAGSVLDELGALDEQANDRYQDRVRPVATEVIVKAVVAGVFGLVALLVSLVLSVRIGRGLIRDLRQLRVEAHEASGVRLPSVMRRLSAGEQVDVETEVPRLEYDKNEMGEVGQALNTLQRAAVEAAVKQAELRSGVSEVFVNLARRSQVLLHKQLTLLDTMERRTEDTEELADLFRLDHLTTRMRRHAEGLVILSGAAPSRQWRKPVQLMDIVRAAVAEVEDYERIEVRRLPRLAATGPAVADLTHLVAELLENATVFSPPHTAVQVYGDRVANGFTLEIHDRGLGMAPEALLEANLRLAETPEFELSDTDRLGLFVVSRLAQRQNVRVSLQPSPYGGTTAVVFIPDALLTDDVPDTNGIGFRLDRPRPPKETEPAENRRSAPASASAPLPGVTASLLDGPVELEAPVGLGALGEFQVPLAEDDDDQGVLFRPRRSLTDPDAAGGDAVDPHRRPPVGPVEPAGPVADGPGAPVPLLPGRRTPKLVSSHGRPVADQRPARAETDPELPGRPGPRRVDDGKPAPLPSRRRGTAARIPHGGPDEGLPGQEHAGRGTQDSSARTALPRRARQTAALSEGPDGETGRRGDAGRDSGSDTGALPRRVRQANLAPQLRQGPAPRAEDRADPPDRDADEVRSRMASLQRGWQRGRVENAAGDDAHSGTAPQGTTKGDGR